MIGIRTPRRLGSRWGSGPNMPGRGSFGDGPGLLSDTKVYFTLRGNFVTHQIAEARGLPLAVFQASSTITPTNKNAQNITGTSSSVAVITEKGLVSVPATNGNTPTRSDEDKEHSRGPRSPSGGGKALSDVDDTAVLLLDG